MTTTAHRQNALTSPASIDAQDSPQRRPTTRGPGGDAFVTVVRARVRREQVRAGLGQAVTSGLAQALQGCEL